MKILLFWKDTPRKRVSARENDDLYTASHKETPSFKEYIPGVTFCNMPTCLYQNRR